MLTKRMLNRFLICLCCIFCMNALQAQSKKITGKITDENGNPLRGATVLVKGQPSGVESNFSGNFSIPVPASGVTLVISYVGYETKEVTIKNEDVIDVELNPLKSNLNEVVVIGYGTQRRKDITGSVASVKGDLFKDQPITNPISALQGRVAGVNVIESSGAPDASPSIVIRGVASFNQPTPLYIVDGARVSDINNINVQDIASIDVLKDAAAAAIYGASAAGGVLVITTKKGSGKVPTINFSARYGTTKPKLVELLGKDDYIKLQNIVNPAFFAGAGQLGRERP